MILAIAFFLFDTLPPCQVRVFVRCTRMFDRCPMYGLYDGVLWTAYATATATERAYLDARFAPYVSMAKASVLARIRVDSDERARRIGARRTP